MIDEMRVWLLCPGIKDFGELPSWFDETDTRDGATQLGSRWRPITEHALRLEGSGLWDSGYCHELLGAIHLSRQLVMLFEHDLIAIVESDRSFAVARIVFEVNWITSPIERPDDAAESKAQAITGRKQHHSFQPETFFSGGWHDAGHRFATENEAEIFVANLRASWIPQGFIKRDRVEIVREAPNAFLNWKTKQAEWFPKAGAEPSETNDNDERGA